MVMAVADASLQTLAKRFDALEARLSRAEQRQKDEGPRQALFERQEAILQRIAALETGSSGQAPTAALDTRAYHMAAACSSSALTRAHCRACCAGSNAAAAARLAPATCSSHCALLDHGACHLLGPHFSTAYACAAPVPNGESETYRKLHSELARRGCRGYRFVRVPVPYYEKPLEFRAERVGAASKDHLCKTMVMENTRAPDDVTDCSNPKLSKYYMVLVQYSAAIDAEKLKAFVHKVCTR